MAKNSYIEFIIRGKIGEINISPKAIELSMLKSFTEDISAIITSIPEVKEQEVIVSVEESSFKAVAYLAIIAVNTITTDATTLNETNDLSTINSVRSKILEKWERKTKANPSLEFEIKPDGKEGIKINSEKKFIKSEDNIWVESELYLYGEVTDLGGQSRPNIHFTTEDKKHFVIDCKREQIISEEKNRVYKHSGVRVLAMQNVYTGEIKDAKFIEFNDYSPVYNNDELQSTIEKGRQSWKDVDDHVEWVRNLRTDG